MDIFRATPLQEIKELQSDPGYTSRVTIDTNIFPESLANNVYIRLNLMNHLCRVAGLTLNIDRVNGQIARPSFQPNDAQNGQATASKTALAEEVENYDDDGFFDKEEPVFARQMEVKLHINRSQLEETARDKGDNDRYHAPTWEDELNRAIRKTLTSKASANLTEDLIPDDWVGMSISLGLGLASFTVTDMLLYTQNLEPHPLVFLAAVEFGFQIGNIAALAYHKKSENPHEFRWSLICGPQYDRDLWVRSMCAITHLLPFVEIKQES